MKMRQLLGMKAAKLIYPATQRATSKLPANNKQLGAGWEVAGMRWYSLVLAGSIRWYSLILAGSIRWYSLVLAGSGTKHVYIFLIFQQLNT